jgi:tetratricopeptide (TPR) repeat protein
VRDLVASLLLPSPLPVAVLGLAGVGKATLVLEALRDPRVVGRFGPRRFFVRCDGARSRNTLLLDLARALGLEPWSDLKPQLLRELGRAPAVLALAGAETPWQGDPDAVEELLAELSTVRGLALVVTLPGDRVPAGPGWREPLRLAPPGLNAARATFLATAGRRFCDDPGLDRLLEAVDRLPLAVSLLAHAAQGEPDLTAICERWQSCRDRRSAWLHRPGVKDWHLQVQIPLEVLLADPRMTPAAGRLLSLLAGLPDGVLPGDLGLLLPGIGEQAVRALQGVGLAFEEHGRLRVLAPVREAVKREHPPCAEDLERAVDLYLERGAATQWLEEPGNLRSMLLEGLDGPHPEPAIRAALGLGDLVRSLGWASGGLGELERAREVAWETGRDELAALCSALLGDLAGNLPDSGAARQRYEEALRHFRHAGDLRGEALCLRNLGDLALDRSDLGAARVRFEGALPLFRLARDSRGAAHCLRRLGDAALERNEPAAARPLYEEALPVYRGLRDRVGQASCLRSLGDIALEQSDPGAARARYDEALALFRRARSFQGEAHCLRSLGDMALFRADFAAAHDRYREAWSLYRRVGDLLGEANCLQRQGDLALALADPGGARSRYDEALRLYAKIGEPYSLGLIHVRLALMSPEGSEERQEHARAARESWEKIRRQDLLEMLREELE